MTELPAPYETGTLHDEGMLDVGDGNRIHWEVRGNPAGKPALVVHGGPGSGCKPASGRALDPARYRIVQFDQRGCGLSTPHASDPATDMSVNTTDRLVTDMERLREHLGIERWLLFGGSWGSTLIVAYAERHPERVAQVVIPAVTMTRRSETAWLYGGAGRFFPAEWERFRKGSGVPERGPVGGGDIAAMLAAYARLAADPDPAVRDRAVEDWCAWEDAVLSQEPHGAARPYSDRPDRDRRALVRICAHYFSQGAFLEEGVLLREAHRLAGIPAVLVHGRLDLGGPLVTAWELARAWPGARLHVVDDAGHKGSPGMRSLLREALDTFAELP